MPVLSLPVGAQSAGHEGWESRASGSVSGGDEPPAWFGGAQSPRVPWEATPATEPAVAMETKDFLKTPAKRRQRPKEAEGKGLS